MPDSPHLHPPHTRFAASHTQAVSVADANASPSATPRNESPSRGPASPKLPLAGLLALATAGFLTIMTEALPAGVLPGMSHDLGVSQSAAGQTVTVYAIGSALAAVPLTKATIGWPRRRLLLIALAGFAIANTVTAVSSDYWLTLGARFVAGVVAGLVWALLAGYARRLVTPGFQGKAMAIAMAGTPVALAVGVPLGTLGAQVVGWRWMFAVMTLLTLVLLAWVLASIPEFAGTSAGAHPYVLPTLRVPGLAAVLFVTLAFVLAHNILYTYIAAYLEPLRLTERVDAVLLAFGIASVASIWITAILIDRHLRALAITACAAFAVSATALWLLSSTVGATDRQAESTSASPLTTLIVFASALIWGLAFGGVATLLQTASAQTAGAAGDIAQSLVVTGWNVGIAGGAMLGGVLVSHTERLPLSALLLTILAGITIIRSRQRGFPPAPLAG